MTSQSTLTHASHIAIVASQPEYGNIAGVLGLILVALGIYVIYLLTRK